jgi:hypothetical protein
MLKHLCLTPIIVLTAFAALAQKLVITPATATFNNTLSGSKDSVQITFSVQQTLNGQDSIIHINDISSLNGVFTCNKTELTISISSPVSVWVYFKPIHNIIHQSWLMVSSDAGNAKVAFPLKGTGTYADLYYSNTQNLSEEALKTALKTIISTGHSALGYNLARDKMFMEIDNQKVNGQGAPVNTLECVYTGRVVTGYTSRADAQTNGNLNTEHTWPQSLFNSNDPMVSDLNHLFVTDNPANGVRSNYPFGMVSSPTWSIGGSKYASGVFEPRDAHKGAVARAMMYFVLRYEDYSTFFAPQEIILRQWHTQFAPNDAQQKRNIAIKAAQGNKNPFIDHPEFAERITLLAGTSVAPVRTTIGYNDAPIDMDVFFADMIANNEGSVHIANTGNANINYTASFAQNKFSLSMATQAGIIHPDSTAQLIYTLTPGDAGDIYDTLIIACNATNAPMVKIPVKATVTIYGGTEENSAGAFTFQVFPNPSNNELNISSQSFQEYEADLTNLQGQQMAHTKGQQHLSIPTAAIPSGIYFVTIRQQQSVQQLKVIIQH